MNKHKMLMLLHEHWMIKRNSCSGFERAETRMQLKIRFTPFCFIFFECSIELLEGLLIFLWKFGLSINRTVAIVSQSFNDNYRLYN